MELISFQTSPRPKKRFLAVFRSSKGQIEKVHFSMKREKGLPMTYIDGASQKKRDAYRARHQKALKSSGRTSPAHLAYHVTWGEAPDLERNLKSYLARFKIKDARN